MHLGNAPKDSNLSKSSVKENSKKQAWVELDQAQPELGIGFN